MRCGAGGRGGRNALCIQAAQYALLYTWCRQMHRPLRVLTKFASRHTDGVVVACVLMEQMSGLKDRKHTAVCSASESVLQKTF